MGNDKTVLQLDSQIKKRYSYRDNGFVDSSGVDNFTTIHQSYYTERDLKWLKENFPKERSKFYLSLEIDTEEKQEMAQEFVKDLLDLCRKEELSITSKSFDHTYDSFNIYTWDEPEMASVLRGLHSEYAELFNDTPHFLQGGVSGVPEDHIGVVDESPRGDSHSSRIGKIGAYLDKHAAAENKITREVWVQACAEIGVKPHATNRMDR